MSDVRGYLPGQTGTLSDVVERGPELAPFTPAGPDGFKAPPSFGEMFSAARPEALRSTSGYDDTKIRDGYAPIVDALGLPASENPVHFPDFQGDERYTLLGAFGVGQPSDLATSSGAGERTIFSSKRAADRTLQEQLIARQIHARRAVDPNFLPGVPDTVEGLHSYFEQQQAAKRAAGAAVLARGSSFGRATAGLAAGFGESAAHEPAFLPSLLIGGGTASGVLQAVGRDALINGILTAGQLPVEAHNMAENGEHLTVGEAAGQVIGGAVTGGIFGGTVRLVGDHIPPLLFKAMPESVQARWASRMSVGGVRLTDVLGDMDNRELAGFARSTIGDQMTADESAAADTLERSQEIGEASPFMPGPAGDAAHNASLADALKGVIDGADRRGPLLSSTALGGTVGAPALGRLDTSAAAVPRDIVDFFKAKGLDEAHAYGIAAGIVAESGGREGALNDKSGAIGLGQWLGARKDALVARYGPNPSRAEQLEFLWGELSGGDPGGKFVLGARDAGEVLDAYVRKFMRPAAGAETLGDLERGSKALGGEIEGAPVEASAAGDDDLAALQRQADQAEQEAIDLSADNGDRAGPRELDPDLPVLKRELFASDRDWAEAQVAFYRDQGLVPNGPEEAAGPPLSSETGSGPPEVAHADASATGASEALDQNILAYEHRLLWAEHSGDASQFELIRSQLDNLRSRKAAAAASDATNEPTADAGASADFSRELYSETASNRIERFTFGKGKNEITGLVSWNPKSTSPAGEIIDLDGAGANTEGVVLTRTLLRHFATAFPELESIHGQRVSGSREGLADRLQKTGMSLARVRALAGPRSIVHAIDDVRINEPALKAFEAAGGAKDQLVSLEHDARMAIADPAIAKRKYQIDDRQLTFGEILEQIDRDRAAAAALRSCAEGAA